MNVVYPANMVEVDLREHEKPREQESFGGMQAAFIEAQYGFRGFAGVVRARQDPDRVDEAKVVESSVRDPCVQRISQEVVHPIDAK